VIGREVHAPRNVEMSYNFIGQRLLAIQKHVFDHIQYHTHDFSLERTHVQPFFRGAVAFARVVPSFVSNDASELARGRVAPQRIEQLHRGLERILKQLSEEFWVIEQIRLARIHVVPRDARIEVTLRIRAKWTAFFRHGTMFRRRANSAHSFHVHYIDHGAFAMNSILDMVCYA
jgi:hypothetical protein